MMNEAPEQKGFHFPSDGMHFAEFIEAETLEIATEIYHKIKRLISAEAAAAEQTAAPAPEADPIVAPEQPATPEPAPAPEVAPETPAVEPAPVSPDAPETPEEKPVQ